ncbi:MAG: hypothetical protein KGO49_05705 [Gammaproteobacteria bacterium]|nr:hypothetical protein [Gammaproteobacteria bacterium]
MIVAGSAYGDEISTQELSTNNPNVTIDPRFYRCTAQDGSYSFFVRSSEPCPHESDKRQPQIVIHAQPSETYLKAQALIDKSDREAREFKKYDGETDADYKVRMEASQNPLWLQNQERLRADQERQQAQQAANQATAEKIRNDERIAQRDSHVMIWLGFFLVLAGPIWWLWHNRTPAKPVRATRRKVSQTSSAPEHMTRPPALLREISPRTSPQPQISNPVSKLAAHQQVERYLHAFDTNGAMPSMAYYAEIKALNLNYSVESLERLDQFLVELRDRIKPSYADLVENPQLQQLVIFLGMYLATTIARVTQQSIKWYDYEGAKARLNDPDYPETLGTLMTCMLGKGYHHLPIELICAILYESNSTESCIERLNYYRQHADILIPIPRSSLHSAVNAQNEEEQAWFNAMSAAGIAATRAIFMNDRSSSLQPTLTVYDPEDNTMRFVVMMDMSSDNAVEEMKYNPRNVPFKVLAYDSYANLPTGRMDAVTLQAQCYGNFAATWIIVIPYRPASHPDGYAFYTPLLVSSSVDTEYNPMLMHAFYSGVDSMKLPDDPWNRYLQESDQVNPN